MIGGSRAAIIGGHVYDIGLIQEAGSTRELCRLEDFASDILVLKLNSHTTIQKIIDLKTNYVGDDAVTCVSLYMERLSAYAVNAKDVPWDERLIYYWTTTMWLTIFDKSAKTFFSNQINMVTESIVMTFLFIRSYVKNTSQFFLLLLCCNTCNGLGPCSPSGLVCETP